MTLTWNALIRAGTTAPVLFALLLLGACASCSKSDQAAENPSGRPTAPATDQDNPRPAPGQLEDSMPNEDTSPADAGQGLQTATLGAGCFWCIEAVLERIDGVTDVVSGYMGGAMPNPDYDSVCTGRTGHAEVVQVTFDPKVLSYDALLDWFFQAHDPTTLNRQGPDRGTQYRSAIFLHTTAQRPLAEAAKRRAAELYADPIVTEITAASTFWPAEDYHQDFFAKNPGHGYCNFHIPPKLKKLGLDKARRQDG